MKLIIFLILPGVIICFYVLSIVSPEFAANIGGSSNLASFLIVLLTYAYVVLTGTTVMELIKTHKEQQRPYIIVDLEFEKRFVDLVIKRNNKI